VLSTVFAGGVYYATWHLLHAGGWSRWLAPAWVLETYGLVAAAFYLAIWKPAYARREERRSLPRLDVAIPVRYATDEGHVGVGILTDMHERGAGLLLSSDPFDTGGVWVQFLWFDDRVGMRGRVVFTRHTNDGLRVGLALQPLHPETARTLTESILPMARSREVGLSLRTLDVLSLWKQPAAAPARRPTLVEIRSGSLRLWAVAEQLDDDGGVLMLPQALPEGVPIKISIWGQSEARECEVFDVDALRRPPVVMYRLSVRYQERLAHSPSAAA
jgi:hypothetical protein